MSARIIYRSLTALGLLLAGVVAGCNSDAKPAASGQPPKLANVSGKGRAELWSQACNRCHNAWSPDQYSAAQWEAIMHHMRVRASLSEDEHQSILEFLKASH